MNPLYWVHWVIRIGVLLAVLWLVRRLMRAPGARRPGAFLPQPAPPASRSARIVEAAVLAAVGAFIIAISATSRSTGGLMLVLDELTPAYARVNVIMFAGAVTGAGFAVALALLGRTVAGAIIMAFVLSGYGLVLNGGSYAGSMFISEEATREPTRYVIDLSGSNVKGADLWVNGVHLGKTPYRTTLDEFEADVPYWPEPPDGYETNMAHLTHWQGRSTLTGNYHRWAELRFPRRPAPGHSLPAGGLPDQRIYYARVRYAGEWGLATGSSGSSSGGGGRSPRASSHLGILFPDRQRRLESLLDLARLADYRVGPDWFEAAETYDEDGWLALQDAAEKEPGMSDALDAWATWRYGLDKATDADSAWDAFLRICDEAEARGQYLTPSVVGRAVELLTPKLPTDRLLDRAVDLIRATEGFTYSKWRANGRVQFGYHQGARVYLGDRRVTGGSSGGRRGAPRLSAGGLAVFHAVWMLYGLEPDLVRDRLAPEIVRHQYDARLIGPMLVAAYLGGPEVDAFLLRQRWRASPADLDRRELVSPAGHDVNKWLYLLAHLNDDAGRAFRRKHAQDVMELADTFFEDFGWRLPEEIDFVFRDPWLAMKYWPRFARLARRESREGALQMQWQYLLRLGDAATPRMFADAWKETDVGLNEFYEAVRLLRRFAPGRRDKVVDLLVQQITQDHGRSAPVYQGFESVDAVVSTLVSRARGGDDARLEDLQLGDADTQARLRENVPMWLAHTEPQSPLVGMLARSDDPDLRLLAMKALQEHPTPEHRALLEKLLQDPVPDVRAAAEEVAAHLDGLRATSPARYASDVSSKAEPGPVPG